MFQSFVLLVGFSKILNSLLFIQLSYIENARLLRGGTTIVFITLGSLSGIIRPFV